MGTQEIMLAGHSLQMKQLSAWESVQCMALCDALVEERAQDDMDPKLLRAVCENAVLGYSCIYDGEKPYFDSPEQVMGVLSLDELAEIYHRYQSAYCRKTGHPEDTFTCRTVSERVSYEDF